MRTAAYGEYRFGIGRYGEVIDGQKKDIAYGFTAPVEVVVDIQYETFFRLLGSFRYGEWRYCTQRYGKSEIPKDNVVRNIRYSFRIWVESINDIKYHVHIPIERIFDIVYENIAHIRKSGNITYGYRTYTSQLRNIYYGHTLARESEKRDIRYGYASAILQLRNIKYSFRRRYTLFTGVVRDVSHSADADHQTVTIRLDRR